MIASHRFLALMALLASLASACGAERETTGGLDAQGNPIVGGSVDQGHSAVALLVVDGGICSGTIIAERVYLTAAHCLPTSNANDYIVAGGTDLFNDDPDYVIDVDAVHIHPSYDPNTNEADFGIVELSSDSPVSPYRWMTLGNDEFYETGASFTAIGYGDTGGGGQGAGTKRKVDMTINDTFADAYLYGDGNDANTCFGDSGGPDIVTHDGYLTVIGVHSFVTNGNCNDQGGSFRTDTVRSFIDNYAAPDAGTAKVGGGGGSGDNPLACSVSSMNPRSPLAATLLALVALGSIALRRTGR